MATKKIQPTNRGANLDSLCPQHRMFCLEMMASELRNPTAVCKKLGYKNPAQMATKIMNKPAVQAILGKFQREREERTKVTSDQIWAYLGRVLFYNPLQLFESNSDGWAIMDLNSIPEEIGQMVEEIETVPTEDGNKVKVRLVSKAKALEIAARHALPQTQLVAVAKPVLDYAEMSKPSDLKAIDVVAKRLEAEERAGA